MSNYRIFKIIMVNNDLLLSILLPVLEWPAVKNTAGHSQVIS